MSNQVQILKDSAIAIQFEIQQLQDLQANHSNVSEKLKNLKERFSDIQGMGELVFSKEMGANEKEIKEFNEIIQRSEQNLNEIETVTKTIFEQKNNQKPVPSKSIFPMPNQMTPSKEAPFESTSLSEITEQNIEYQKGQLKDYSVELNELLSSIEKSSPEEGFKKLLDFFEKINQMHQTTRFETFTIEKGFEGLLKDLKEQMQILITKQKDNESTHLELLSKQKSLIQALESNSADNIDDVYSGFTLEDKNKLLQTLSDLLKNNKKRPNGLTAFFLGEPFSKWPGSNEDKLQAAQNLHPKNQNSSSVLEEMKRQFKEATTVKTPSTPSFQLDPKDYDLLDLDNDPEKFEDQVGHFDTSQWNDPNFIRQQKELLKSTSSYQSGPYNNGFDDFDYDPKKFENSDDDFDASQLNDLNFIREQKELFGEKEFHHPSQSFNDLDFDLQTLSLDSPSIPSYSNIKELENVLTHLNKNDLFMALAVLKTFESKKIIGAFQITSKIPILVADRPCFHLYFIHKNENSSLLKEDYNYGNKAMQGEYQATNLERKRAIQRTLIELALEGLEDAINFDATPDIIEMLKVLEKTPMDSNDLLNNSNIDHVLFGKMYQLHTDARKKDKSLVDPEEGQFNKEFGRLAFKLTNKGIKNETKIAAINAIRIELKKAWKLQ